MLTIQRRIGIIYTNTVKLGTVAGTPRCQNKSDMFRRKRVRVMREFAVPLLLFVASHVMILGFAVQMYSIAP